MMAAMQNPENSLIELLAGFDTVEPVPQVEIDGVSIDSREVSTGSLFIALRGINTNGIDYAREAVEAGAVAVLYDAGDAHACQRISWLRKQVSSRWIGVFDLAEVHGLIVARVFGLPAQSMTIVGVTGTDGKSSVTHLLVQALTRLGRISASIGTLGYGVGNQLSPDSLTTPDAVALQSRLHEFSQQQCEYVIMEVSSHALEQHRVAGCDFDIAVLTNLGRDHLDYHQSIESYAAAKEKLFTRFDLSARIVNADDAFGQRIAAEAEAESLYRYSTSLTADPQAEIRLIAVERTASGQNIRMLTPVGEVVARTALIGHFNVHNTLACVATLVALGLSPDQLEYAVSDLRPIPGRMELFVGDAEQPTALIDFAHTEQALRACLEACRAHTQGRIWCVFGCGGDRDPGKRSGMGRVVEELADRVIVTDDNPRHESPQTIVADILMGMRAPEQASVVHSRKAAIQYALAEAVASDLVVISGKGHEQFQIVGHEQRPFSDRHIVAEMLQFGSDD